jgi:hypothetical protein
MPVTVNKVFPFSYGECVSNILKRILKFSGKKVKNTCAWNLDRPDPDRHAMDADPDPDPTKIMRIRPDLNPNPQHCMILKRSVTATIFFLLRSIPKHKVGSFQKN